MFGDYYQVRDWLEGFVPLTYSRKDLGLERIKYLLNLLDNPQNKFKSIHVAGTSGKGSTAFYIARLLEVSHVPKVPKVPKAYDTYDTFRTSRTFKVGLHLSPHLADIRERMQIFQCQMSNVKCQMSGKGLMPMRRFIELFNEIYPIVEKIKKTNSDLTPSYFEILVAASFKYFAEEKVDWAVVEVGLGGRLDATNVLNPQITLITNVGLDHTDVLGKTVEEIAYEKAGIIKRVRALESQRVRGIPVITGAIGKALEVIEKAAREKKAPLIKIDTQSWPKTLKSDTKDYLIKYYDIVRHIPRNFVLENVLLAISALRALGYGITKSALKKALSMPFAGRLETIDRRVILDGAHNPDKIKCLLNFVISNFNPSSTESRRGREFQISNEKNILRTIRQKSESREVSTKNIINSKVSSRQARTITSVVLVLAFKKGKDWQKMIDLLIKNLPVKKVISTKFHAVTDMGRYQAVDPKEIKDYLDTKYKIQDTRYFNNSHQAVFSALDSNTLGTSELVLVTGSLYLVGEVRTIWHLPSF